MHQINIITGTLLFTKELPSKFRTSLYKAFDMKDHTTVFAEKGKRWNLHALTWLIGSAEKNSYNISYFDSKANLHEITVQNLPFIYEGVSAANLYELIVKTSLADKFLRTFPHQFVAVTKEALDMPFDEQPWFFGNISQEEAKSILIGTQRYTF